MVLGLRCLLRGQGSIWDLRNPAEHTDRLQVAGSSCEWKVFPASMVNPVSRELEVKTASAQSIRVGLVQAGRQAAEGEGRELWAYHAPCSCCSEVRGTETEGAGEGTQGDPKCGWGWGSDGAVGVQTLEAGNPGDS